jgi:hypothetical protein
MTGIGKKRLKVSANSSAPFHFYENSMAVSIVISLAFSPVHRGATPNIRSHHKRPPRQYEPKPGKREKILPSWGGGYGKCTGEDFFNQLFRNCRAGSEWRCD